MAQSTGLRTLGTRPIGRVVLVALAVITLGFSIVFLGYLIGIGAFLLFGLALPIYAGIKRPRTLAILGLVTMLLAAPLASALVTQQTFAPSPAVSSFTMNGGSVLQNATVHPFSADAGSNFSFQVDVVPHYLNANTTLENLTLFVTTCPYVTAPNQSSLNCGTFVSYHQVLPLNLSPTSAPTTVVFHQKLAGPNIYWWTAYGTYTKNAPCSANCTNYTFLAPGNGYADVQGPVSGDFFSILGIVILPVYVMFLYPAFAFYAALLFYMWFKAREARRKAEEQALGRGAPVATTEAAGTAAAGAAATSGPTELHCPKCQAVVYPNESNCWKCGTALSGPGSSPPLPSGGAPPPSS